MQNGIQRNRKELVVTTSHHHTGSGVTAPHRRLGRKLIALAALAVAIGGTSSVAGAFTGTGGGGAGRFAASFDARAVGDPTITSCPDLGREALKIEARYGGTMTIDGEEFAFNFTTLEALIDRSTGVGTAEGRWQLTDLRSQEIVGRGELVGTVTADPPSEVEPPEPDVELHGLLIGLVEPPEPDMPAQRLIGNFTASLGDGATFPHLKGAVGDPSVGDPSVGDPSSPAVLLPAVKC